MPSEQQTVIERSAAPKPLRKTPAFLASAGVVAALLAVGAVATVDRMLAEPAGAAAAEPSPSASAEPDTVSAGEGGAGDAEDTAAACGMGTGSTDEFTAFPADANWDDRVAGFQVPSSEVHGPGEVQESGFRQCFAKSPQGAVLAGIAVVAMSADPAMADEVAERAFTEGSAPQEAQGGGAAGGTSTLGQNDRLDGARLAAYGSDRARVDVAVSAAGAAPAAVRVDLAWEQDDWKAVPADGGAVADPASPLQDTSGFVPTPMAEQEEAANPLS